MANIYFLLPPPTALLCSIFSQLYGNTYRPGIVRQIGEVMEMKKVSSCISTVFLLLSFTSFVSSQSDSCSSHLSVSNLIPFDTSSLTCVSAWSFEGFILRYTKAGPSLWNFVLSSPDSGTYVAIGFSPNGGMVGSSAMAGWMPSGGPGVAKQYYLGGYSSTQCLPDQGNLPLVKGSSLMVSQSSRLYLAFQLNTTQPQTNLVYAVGPSNTLPSSGGYLATHRNMASGTLSAPAGGGGGGDDSGGENGGEVPNGGDGGNSTNDSPNYNSGGSSSVLTGVVGWSISSERKHALLTIIALFVVQFFLCLLGL